MMSGNIASNLAPKPSKIMNRNKVPYLLAIFILIVSSILLYQNNETISVLKTEKDHLTQEVNEQTVNVQALTDQVTLMGETTEFLNNSLITTLESIEVERELELGTYARVLSVERIIYAYMFNEKVNCTFSVNYSFPGPTETVFLVLDADEITVLGYEEFSLDGSGVATVTIEIPLPEVSGKWHIAPSVYWLSGGAPTYSTNGWKLHTSFEVLNVDPGHSQGSCGEESVACHESVG